jgi:hypothetical protein
MYAAEIALFFQASLTIVYVYRIAPFCEYASETTFTVLGCCLGMVRQIDSNQNYFYGERSIVDASVPNVRFPNTL